MSADQLHPDGASQLIPPDPAPLQLPCSGTALPHQTLRPFLDTSPLQQLSAARALASCPLDPSASAYAPGLRVPCTPALWLRLRPRPGSSETLSPFSRERLPGLCLAPRRQADTGAKSMKSPSRGGQGQLQTAGVPG